MLRSRLPQITVQIDILVEQAIEAGADQVAQEAKSRVPVQSGKLRDAIHVEPEHEGVYVVGGDDEAWYGHFVEYGTAKNAPKPFLVPSLEGNRNDVVDRVKNSLRTL